LKALLLLFFHLHHTLTRGTVDETIAEVKEKILKVGKGGGYILATANGITDYCITENVLAMNDTLIKYGWYK
jgi:uroporphyrinogen decarboxylase